MRVRSGRPLPARPGYRRFPGSRRTSTRHLDGKTARSATPVSGSPARQYRGHAIATLDRKPSHGPHGRCRERPLRPTGGSPAVLFDVDRSQVDSNYLHVCAWQRAFDGEGIAGAAWRIHRCIGMEGTRLVRTLSDTSSGEAPADMREQLSDGHSRCHGESHRCSHHCPAPAHCRPGLHPPSAPVANYCNCIPAVGFWLHQARGYPTAGRQHPLSTPGISQHADCRQITNHVATQMHMSEGCPDRLIADHSRGYDRAGVESRAPRLAG